MVESIVSGHLENSEFLRCTHFQLRKKYDTQMTQILLAEYIFIYKLKKGAFGIRGVTFTKSTFFVG